MIKTIGIPVSLVPGFLSYSHREIPEKGADRPNAIPSHSSLEIVLESTKIYQ